MEDYKQLIERMKTDAEWAEANEWESPICLYDDLIGAIKAIEDLTAELIDERDNHDRLQDFEVAEAKELDRIKQVMKVSVTPHFPGDGGILAMPMKKNIPVGHEDWKLTTCPICGAACWVSDLHRQALMFEPGLMVACTECALRAGLGKGGAE